jgi:hypothetical protein
LREAPTVEIRTPQGKLFTAPRCPVAQGTFDEIMIYWYQGRGRREASEYSDKINTIWDGFGRRRGDTAQWFA